MNCTEINTHIDDYLDGNLLLQDRQAVEQHLLECQACADKVKGMNFMLASLKDLSVPEATADFEARVFREVRRQYPERSASHFVAGFATAMAAGVALWFASTIFFVPQQSLNTPDVITVAMNDARTVRLLLEAPDDIAQVTLSIGLPANVELTGYPGRNNLTWQTSLKKGQNVLALPIMAIDSGKGELVAQLSYGDKLKTYRLVLKTTENGVMNYQIQPVTSA
ncbi:MAG: zf-HC2 domain-containing protein [Gammaproteobacteria bacterium]|nr:zf-HC2 domain-containing protein [Gammaproteobacteria bacterium]